MNPLKNPFSPGAGSQPPELAGREVVLRDVDATLERVRLGVFSRSAIFYGLRGVGKTVLLNKVRESAEEKGFLTIFIEAREDKRLPQILLPHLRKVLLHLDSFRQVTEAAKRALRVLKSFASGASVKLAAGDFNVELGVAAESGVADSGDLEHDLGELLVSVAMAAASKGAAVCMVIDELQYLSELEMSALIMALHQISQRNLPMVMYAAGLPLILGLAGRSKSYAERLFAFPKIDVLEEGAARLAIERPMKNNGVSFSHEAMAEVLQTTGGYPYFLQQWGYEIWNCSTSAEVTVGEVKQATANAIQQLDEQFFRVRFDRLTKREKDFLFAMMKVGGNQPRSGDIADQLGIKATSIGPLRSALIKKGMIYSPAHGDNAYTVPLFDGYLKRQLGTS